MSEQNRLIYAICCPFTNKRHYIGKTTNGMLRPLQHARESHSAKVKEWVDNLRELGHTPLIEILESPLPTDNIDERERYWILKELKSGGLLLNSNLIDVSTINPKINDCLSPETSHPVIRIGKFLKSRRKILKITQSEMAAKSGVGLRFVRELEQGRKKTLNIGLIQQVLDLFGCTLSVTQKKHV